MGLLLERDHQLLASLEKLNHLVEILEQHYEESEDEQVLRRFCTVKSDIGRVLLGLGEFEDAVENSSTALDLSQDIDGLEKPRLSAQITVGLGYYFLGEFEDAIDVFQTVLAESNENVDVMLLVARSLWAVGGEKEREIAIDQIRDWYVFNIRMLMIAYQRSHSMLDLWHRWVLSEYSFTIRVPCNNLRLLCGTQQSIRKIMSIFANY